MQKGFRTRRKGWQDGPRGMSTEQLQRSGAAQRARRLGVAPRQSRTLHSRGENAPWPPRLRACRRQGCTSPGPAPRLLSADGPLAQPCRPRRHLRSASAYRHERSNQGASWGVMTGTERAASRGGRTGEGTCSPAESLRLNNLTKPATRTRRYARPIFIPSLGYLNGRSRWPVWLPPWRHWRASRHCADTLILPGVSTVRSQVFPRGSGEVHWRIVQ